MQTLYCGPEMYVVRFCYCCISAPLRTLLSLDHRWSSDTRRVLVHAKVFVLAVCVIALWATLMIRTKFSKQYGVMTPFNQ